MFNRLGPRMAGGSALLLLAMACSSGGGDGAGGDSGVRETASAAIEATAEAQVSGLTAGSAEAFRPIPDATATAQAGASEPGADRVRADAVTVPTGLTLPFDAGAALVGREIMSPFGVYRKSADRPESGHAGIDVPMANGAPIFAVADGRVVTVEPTMDHRPGEIVEILIGDDVQPGAGSNQGWIFIYEHITLEPGIAVGTAVSRGQQIGANAMPTGENNNHLQLTFVFNEQGFTRDHTCWPDQLATDARAELDVWFAALKTSDTLLSGWRTVIDEGYYPLRGLLDEAAYPDGPQLCYEQGTDVRVVY